MRSRANLTGHLVWGGLTRFAHRFQYPCFPGSKFPRCMSTISWATSIATFEKSSGINKIHLANGNDDPIIVFFGYCTQGILHLGNQTSFVLGQPYLEGGWKIHRQTVRRQLTESPSKSSS